MQQQQQQLHSLKVPILLLGWTIATLLGARWLHAPLLCYRPVPGLWDLGRAPPSQGFLRVGSAICALLLTSMIRIHQNLILKPVPWSCCWRKKTTPQVCFRGDSEDRHLLFTRVLLVQKDSETFGSVSPRSLRKRSTLMQRCDLQLQVIWRPLALPCKVYSRIATNLRCGGGYLDLGCLYVLPASNIHLDFKKLYHFRSFGKPVPFL